MLDARRRIVGIDYGTRRVGVAVSDPLQIFAQPDGTYSEEEALQRLKQIHQNQGIEAVVIGWPLTLEGNEGKAVAFVRPFVNRLKKRFTDVRIVTWDERFTSERARDALIEAGVKKKDRRIKGRVDAAAAAVILQEYLDEHRRSERHRPSPDWKIG